MASDELTPDDTALLDEYAALLADPTMWAVPAPELEDRVVEAIIAEAAGSSTNTYYVYRQPSRARRWATLAGAALVGAAAAAVVTVAIWTGFIIIGRASAAHTPATPAHPPRLR